jgi:uncharacterized membrane protein YdjX (TVP38/TMEM64 family)
MTILQIYRRRASAIAVCVLTVALISGAVWGLSRLWPDEINPEAFTELIRSWGAWGVVGSILLMIIHSFIPFPAEFVAVANGMVYGPLWGTVLTWVGAMLGAVLSFALSRRFGRPFVERMVEREDWRKFDAWLGENGGRAVFFSRFIPVIAFNLINYAAGLSRISFGGFILATGFGILPMTILMVVLGAKMQILSLEIWLLMGGTGILLWLIAHRLWAGKVKPPD